MSDPGPDRRPRPDPAGTPGSGGSTVASGPAPPARFAASTSATARRWRCRTSASRSPPARSTPSSARTAPGKSTLGKIIAGAVAPDAGEILVDGEPVSYRAPRDAIRHGIGIIEQEFALAPDLSVLDNVFLGIELGRRGLVDRAPAARALRRARRAHRLSPARVGDRADAAHRRPAEGRDPAPARPRHAAHRDGRADRGADPRRGRPAAGDHARAARRRRHRDLRLAHPRRGARPVRHGHRAQGRPPREDDAGLRGDLRQPGHGDARALARRRLPDAACRRRPTRRSCSRCAG